MSLIAHKYSSATTLLHSCNTRPSIDPRRYRRLSQAIRTLACMDLNPVGLEPPDMSRWFDHGTEFVSVEGWRARLHCTQVTLPMPSGRLVVMHGGLYVYGRSHAAHPDGV